MKKILKTLGILLLVLVLAAGSFIGYLSVTEYRPKDVSQAEFLQKDLYRPLSAGNELTLLSWNIGYAGLDKEEDFFMDGGESVHPIDQAHVDANLAAIDSYIAGAGADIVLLQEVDRDSRRSGRVDELASITQASGMDYSYAPNYRCAFVPFPWPPIGKVESGIATLTSFTFSDSTRVSLPCPFSWPVRVANLKRGLLVNRMPVDNGRELVLINLHLEAYDDGEGKAAQTRQLMELLEAEVQKGNYVIAGGDFNQTFPGALSAYPIQSEELWTPGVLEENSLPQGMRFCFDASTPSCRSLDRALDREDPTMQYYLIDGFIISENVRLEQVETVSLDFENSDHNPVMLRVTLA